MFRSEYRFKFYLNAMHSVKIEDSESKIHPHTWELVVHVQKKVEEFIQFSKVEEAVKEYISIYEGKYLNSVSPFDTMMPFMENIGQYFFSTISEILHRNGWFLESMEISENPSRTYLISGLKTNDNGMERLNTDKQEALESSTPDKECRQHGVVPFCILQNCSLQKLNVIQRAAAALRVCSSARRLGALAQRVDEWNEAAVQAEKLAAKAETLAAIENDIYNILEIKEYKLMMFPTTPLKLAEEEAALSVEVQNENAVTDTVLDIVSNNSIIEAQNVDIVRECNSMTTNKGRVPYLMVSLLIVLAAVVPMMLWINRNGLYPWGSDSWYHLFKGHYLYNEVKAGNFFPLYTDLWYNGIQPLRYWAPLPHYVLAIFEFLTEGNTELSYNIFIGFVFIAGSLGWVLWGEAAGRRKLALALALLWFFLPDNLRVLFSEGNLSRVAVTTVFPYLLLNIWSYLEKKKTVNIILVSFLMMVITLCHAMISAMTGITVFGFVLLYGIIQKKIRRSFAILAAVLIDIMLSGIWLYPALNGGIMSMDREAVSELMKGLTYPAFQSLNPLVRLSNPDEFYFGVSIFATAVIGILLGDRKSKAGFCMTLLIFMGTTKTLLPLLIKIPMSQLFWMMRFTPLAMGMFFSGLLLWRKIRKEVIITIIVILVIDSALSFSILGTNGQMPEEVKNTLDIAVNSGAYRIAVLDESSFGSFPGYYISNNRSGKRVLQVYGAGWQGAETAQNLVWLNASFEKGWYTFLFDRCLELGADAIVARSSSIRNMQDFMQKAAEAGYRKIDQTKTGVILKYNIDHIFGTDVKYEGLAIGRFSENIAYIFPQFAIGNSIYIDDYLSGNLSKYSVIYLSGFKYRDRKKAENMVKDLSQKGVRFVVDLTNADAELLSSRAGFLDVVSQPVTFTSKYPVLNIGSSKVEISEFFPGEEIKWRTNYLENLDEVVGTAEFQNQEFGFMGTKLNKNIVFIGFNIPFFTVETGSKPGIRILETATGFKALQAPERELVNTEVTTNRDTIYIKSEKEGVLTGIANFDSMISLQGRYENRHNLVYMKDRELVLKVLYPHLIPGLVLSIMGLVGILVLFIVHRKINVSQSVE